MGKKPTPTTRSKTSKTSRMRRITFVDEEWTQRAAMGWEMELGKLEKVIGGAQSKQ
jgi:hypothetical protein